MMYTDKVMEHFQNPRNVGTISDADGVGQVGNPVCGDMMTFYIKVKDNRLADIKFQTFGCGAAIAVSSMVSEMAKGKTLEEAAKITNDSVAEELGGLPKNKLHCSNLGADALHSAIEDFRAKREGRTPAPPAPEHEHGSCPYCDGPIEDSSAVCKSCQIEFEECPHCGQITNARGEKCIHCGADLHKS